MRILQKFVKGKYPGAGGFRLTSFTDRLPYSSSYMACPNGQAGFALKERSIC